MNEPEMWKKLVDSFATIRFNVISSGTTKNKLQEQICMKHFVPNTQLAVALFNQWLVKAYQQHWELLDDEDWEMFDRLVPNLLTLRCLHS